MYPKTIEGNTANARRMKLERRIVRKTVDALLAAGYLLGTDQGGEIQPEPSTNRTAILDLMVETDEEHLNVFRDGDCVAWVFFVYGSDGYDVICDYTVNLDDVLKPVFDYALTFDDILDR